VILPLAASFLPMLPSLRAVKIGLAAVVLTAAFYAGWTVQGWRYKSQEVKAYQEQVERFREQARLDRADLERINKARAKADEDAIKYRGLWAQAKRDPVVKSWADTRHPATINLILRGSGAELPNHGDTRP